MAQKSNSKWFMEAFYIYALFSTPRTCLWEADSFIQKHLEVHPEGKSELGDMSGYLHRRAVLSNVSSTKTYNTTKIKLRINYIIEGGKYQLWCLTVQLEILRNIGNFCFLSRKRKVFVMHCIQSRMCLKDNRLHLKLGNLILLGTQN